jgi:5'-3' exonuclease
MGVPRYFRVVSELYGQHIVFPAGAPEAPPGEDDEAVKSCASLYLDANCLIHPCVQRVLAAPEHAGVTTAVEPDLVSDMYTTIADYIAHLVSVSKPSELLYIAIDGVAPRAKMHTQRHRRYKSAQSRQASDELWAKLGLPERASQFDTNAISPGTVWLHGLTAYLVAHLRQHMQRKLDAAGADGVVATGAWELPAQILLSGDGVPGEGEHKIMDHIRKAAPAAESTFAVVYGLDADLIFLTMCTQRPGLRLLRERVYFQDQARNSLVSVPDAQVEFDYMDIDRFRECLVVQVKHAVESAPSAVEVAPAPVVRPVAREGAAALPILRMNTMLRMSDAAVCVTDYTVLCFLFGNDFIPHNPTISLRGKGLDALLCAYGRTVQRMSKALSGRVSKAGSKKASGHWRINTDVMTELLRNMASREVALLQEESQRWASMRMYPYARNASKTAPENAHAAAMYANERVQRDPVEREILLHLMDVSIPGWKQRYYAHFFGIDPSAPGVSPVLDDACCSLLKTMAWNLDYYTTGCPSHAWFYEYEHVPFFSDLAAYLERHPQFFELEVAFEQTRPLKPLSQLMCVLPPQSAALLPASYAALMADAESPIGHLYPLRFTVDKFRNFFVSEAVPHLPPMDAGAVQAAVENCALSARDKKLNAVQKREASC